MSDVALRDVLTAPVLDQSSRAARALPYPEDAVLHLTDPPRHGRDLSPS